MEPKETTTPKLKQIFSEAIITPVKNGFIVTFQPSIGNKSVYIAKTLAEAKTLLEKLLIK